MEIFYSLEANLAQRIAYASYVANFLRIWRASLTREKEMALKDSFISREAYQDAGLFLVTMLCSLSRRLVIMPRIILFAFPDLEQMFSRNTCPQMDHLSSTSTTIPLQACTEILVT